MARRAGNVAPHDVYTTVAPPDLPMEEREDREAVRARMEAKRAAAVARSPFARPPAPSSRVRVDADPDLDAAKFMTPAIDADVDVEPVPAARAPRRAAAPSGRVAPERRAGGPAPVPAVAPEPAPSDMAAFVRPSKGAAAQRAAARIAQAGGTPAEVRAWAEARSIPCPARGIIPARVADMWLADLSLARVASRADEQPSPDVVEQVVEPIRANPPVGGDADTPPTTGVLMDDVGLDIGVAVREEMSRVFPPPAWASTEPVPAAVDRPIPYQLAAPRPGLADSLRELVDDVDSLGRASALVTHAVHRIHRHLNDVIAILDERDARTPGGHQ